MIEQLKRLIRPLKTRIQLMVGRAIVSAVYDSEGIQKLQIETLNGVRDSIPKFQNYGFTSFPLPGSEGLILSVGSNYEDGVCIAIDDKKNRLKNLESGESAMYDHQGQMIKVKKDGTIEISAKNKVKIIAPDQYTMSSNKSIQTVTDYQVDASNTILNTDKIKIENSTGELIQTLREFINSVETGYVVTAVGIQKLNPGGEAFAALKNKVQSFEE